MWTELDQRDIGGGVRTLASQVGPIGCLVLVITDRDHGSRSVSTTFVPGVQLKDKKLEPAAGYGEPPQIPDFDQ